MKTSVKAMLVANAVLLALLLIAVIYALMDQTEAPAQSDHANLPQVVGAPHKC